VTNKLNKGVEDNHIDELVPSVEPTPNYVVIPEHITSPSESSQSMVVSQIESVVVEGIPEAHIGDNFIIHQNPIVEPSFSQIGAQNQN
jgi:hypothetical protein